MTDVKKLLGQSKNVFAAAEIVELLREVNFADFERVPELKALMDSLLNLREERQRISESLHLIPYEDLRGLFRDYVEEHFDSYLQKFFDRLYAGMMKVHTLTLGKRLDQLEAAITDMKTSNLMGMMNPWAWVEMEVVKEVLLYLPVQPNSMATIHDIFTHLAYQTRLPIPGAGRAEKYVWLTEVLSKVECLREHDGFLIELTTTSIIEEPERYAQSQRHRSTLQNAVREVDAKQDLRGTPNDGADGKVRDS